MTIDADLMDIAVSIEKDIPSRITGENRVFIRAVIARALSNARSQAFEEASKIALTAGPEHYASTHPGHHRVAVELEHFISQAIRQHSQKGRDND